MEASAKSVLRQWMFCFRKSHFIIYIAASLPFTRPLCVVLAGKDFELSKSVKLKVKVKPMLTVVQYELKPN